MIALDDGDESAVEEQFQEVKRRFVAGLSQRLAVATHALAQVEGEDERSGTAVASLYETVHALCGVAPMLGFPALGDAARRMDNALVAAFRTKRGLGRGEAERLQPLFARLQGACSAALGPSKCQFDVILAGTPADRHAPYR